MKYLRYAVHIYVQVTKLLKTAHLLHCYDFLDQGGTSSHGDLESGNHKPFCVYQSTVVDQKFHAYTVYM